MISEKLKNSLLERANTSLLDFNTLLDFLDNSKFQFVDGKLREVLGIATKNRAFFDLNHLMSFDDEYIFFTILHEYAHILAIEKMGKESMISYFSETDPDLFANHFIDEEVLADRFACFYFYKLNKRLFPRYRTQRFDNQNFRDLYKSDIVDMMGHVNCEKDYDDYFDFYILDWNDINVSTPTWYVNVDLILDNQIRYDFHRLQGEDSIYYGTLDSSEIIYESDVLFWRENKNYGESGE